MKKSELVARLASRYRKLTQADIDASVSLILTAITDRLAVGGRIEIRGLGAFTVHHRPSWFSRDPRSGAPVSVPAKYLPHFKPGKELQCRVAKAAEQVKTTTTKSAEELEPA